VSVDGVAEGKSFQRDLTFTAALDLGQLRAFYREALVREGFQAEPVSVDKPDRWQQGFFRGDEVIHLSARPGPTGRSKVDVIWVTHPIAGEEP